VRKKKLTILIKPGNIERNEVAGKSVYIEFS